MMRHASNKRRPVVKNVGIIRRPLRYRLLKRLVVLPALHQVLFVFCRATACSVFEFHTFPPYLSYIHCVLFKLFAQIFLFPVYHSISFLIAFTISS